jgi:hypothetical protein
MTYEPKPFNAPELKIVYSSVLIDVPPGKEKESVALFSEEGASGFYFNGFRGVDQETVNRVLDIASPEIVGVSGFKDFDFTPIYGNRAICGLILGYKMEWPEFKKIDQLKLFSSQDFQGNAREFPLCLECLDLQKMPDADLGNFSFLKKLKVLRLGHASRLAKLDGLPSTVTELELLYCSKLKNI